jgi:hypothetical protein
MKFFLSFLVLFIPLISFSQANYLKGYVITTKGDTIKGFINYGNWNYNPQKIKFKTVDNLLQTYTPEQVQYVNIEGVNEYQSYHGPITLDNTKGNNYFIDTNKAIVNIFLRVLQRGKNLSFFEYNDHVNVRYFVQENGSKDVNQLIEHGGGTDRTDFLAAINPYKIQLTNEAAKFNAATDDLVSIVDYAEYTELAIGDVIKKINRDNYIIVKKKKEKIATFYIGAGINISSASYTGSLVTANERLGSKSSYLPKVDLGDDFFLDPYVKRIVFRVELSFEASKQALNSNTSYDIVSRYNAYTATLSPQIIYNIYNNPSFKVYLGAGVSENFVLYNNVIDNYGLGLYQDGYLNKIYLCFPVRVGVILNQHIEISVTYADFNSINVDHYYGINNSLIQIGINYLFK